MKLRRAVFLTLIVAPGIAVVANSKWLIFDESEPGWARDHEWVDGKQAAWGPRPRALFRAPSGMERHYTGNEWYYKVYKDYCMEWTKKNGYGYPKQDWV